MKLLEKTEKEFVRIIIGRAVSRVSGIKAPTETISVEETNVKEVAEKIRDMIKKEGKKK